MVMRRPPVIVLIDYIRSVFRAVLGRVVPEGRMVRRPYEAHPIRKVGRTFLFLLYLFQR